MINKLLSFVTSLTLLIVAFFLLFAIWSPDRVATLVAEYPLSLTLAALFSLFLSLLNFQREAKSLPAYTFHLERGRGTVSVETLKKGIKTFFKAESPQMHLISCHLKESGKLLELNLEGKIEPKLLETLSEVLTEQFGFSGQLDIFFESPKSIV